MLVLSVILVVGYGIDVVMIIFCCGCCKLLAHSEKKNSYLLILSYQDSTEVQVQRRNLSVV